MRRLGSGWCLKLPLTLFLFLTALPEPPLLAVTASIGHPYHGRLINGVPFPNQFRGYQLRDEERSYTTPEVIGAVLDAIDAVRAQYPETCDLFMGDFSRSGGGWLNHHRSHQNGRDVDLGLYARGNRTLDTFVPMNEENLDVPKTWTFIENLLRSQHVQYIFLDGRIQRLLYDYATSRGINTGYLDSLFGNHRGAVIQHVSRHQDHMHVRFYTPWSTMAGRSDHDDIHKMTVIEMAQQAYLPKRVNYYVRGTERGIESLAKSFGVNPKDLCRWNQIHLNEVLTPGACLVYYKRGFEMEPVNLARSLQPSSVAELPAVRMAALNTQRPATDASGFSKDSSPRDSRDSSSNTFSYTVKRGDTLESVAKRVGIDVKTLRELNGMRQKASIKPGQRIQLTSLRIPSKHSSSSRSTQSRVQWVHSEKPSRSVPVQNIGKPTSPLKPTHQSTMSGSLKPSASNASKPSVTARNPGTAGSCALTLPKVQDVKKNLERSSALAKGPSPKKSSKR